MILLAAALAKPPPLLPLETLLGNPEKAAAQLSPDGKLLGLLGDTSITLLSLSGGKPRVIPRRMPMEGFAGWSHGGRYLYVWARDSVPARVDRIDSGTLRPDTGRAQRSGHPPRTVAEPPSADRM